MLAFEIQLDGLVATNTTISREIESCVTAKGCKHGAGGLSGMPLTRRSTEIVKYLVINTQGNIPIIASGGIFSR